MKENRNVHMALDYLTGTPATALAEREKVTLTRVYQILDKLAYRFTGFSSIRHVPKERLYSALLRAIKPDLRHVEPGAAQTPEEFYVEMNDEPRVRDFS